MIHWFFSLMSLFACVQLMSPRPNTQHSLLRLTLLFSSHCGKLSFLGPYCHSDISSPGLHRLWLKVGPLHLCPDPHSSPLPGLPIIRPQFTQCSWKDFFRPSLMSPVRKEQQGAGEKSGVVSVPVLESYIELDRGFEVKYSSEMMDRFQKVQCKLFIQF